MNFLKLLEEKIFNQEAIVGVIGLGYVGLPVACVLADSGFNVIGVDVKKERIDMINAGISPIEGKEPGLAKLLSRVVEQQSLRATTNYKDLELADIILIDVETPIDDNHIPQYVALRSACRSLGPVLKSGALVIVESTIAPGTMKTVVRPLLEESSGKQSGKDFFLGACPERVMPGKLLSNLKTMSRVCGGETLEVTMILKSFYGKFVESDLDTTDLITAEITKTAENAYRDVNIAFANELALICQSIGADFLKVREVVNKSPGRNVLLAGAGVGGHCIPKDPWLLAYGVKEKLELSLIPAARLVNDSMPNQIVKMLMTALAGQNIALKDAKIAVLGFSYLEESDDVRNSPSEKLVEILNQHQTQVVIHDPYVTDYNKDIFESVKGCDAVIFMVAHEAYKRMDLEELAKRLSRPILIDGRRIIKSEDAIQAGFNYYGIGFGL
jgi:UDP-N-acetyl-D-mannosaminuronic acid dehydrogenase